MTEAVNHPAHYGGADNPYEHIKVSNAWGLNYELGNATKYICRAGKKTASALEDLKKARFYIDYEIKKLEEANNIASQKKDPTCAVVGCSNSLSYKLDGKFYCAEHTPKSAFTPCAVRGCPSPGIVGGRGVFSYCKEHLPVEPQKVSPAG